MHITHSYLGTTKGRFRCLFFLLLKDYIEVESKVAKDLEGDLERFARTMKDGGALVRPFKGDIERARTEVLGKNWPPAEREEIIRTPGLLAIDVDFDTFDPQQNRWFYVSLESVGSDRPWSQATRRSVHDVAELLNKLAEAVTDAEADVFDAAHDVLHDVKLTHAAKLFEAKPGIFGFSIDLVQGAQFVHELWLKLTKNKRVFTVTADGEGWTQCPGCSKSFTITNKGSWDGRKHVTCGTHLTVQTSGGGAA